MELVVDCIIRQSIHPVGSTNTTERYRAMRPLTLAVPATIDSEPRLAVGTGERGEGHWHALLFLIL